MKQVCTTILLLVCFLNVKLSGQVVFDYSGAELVIDNINNLNSSTEKKITNHPAYQHIFNHSRKFSSKPLTEENLINSLEGKKDGFDFSGIKDRIDSLRQIIQWLKNNEQEIQNIYAKLPLDYLPKDYRQNATIYFVIGGYNGIAFDNRICVNIDNKQFRKNNNEIKLYIAHELFHIGFEKYHQLPEIFQAKTVKDLKYIVLSMAVNEGLATLTPYHKRIGLNEISDYDYKVLLDSIQLIKKVNQFNSVLKYLDDNIDREVSNEILGEVLGQCSGDRLFYIVGCYMGLSIEGKYGKETILELIKKTPEEFIEVFKELGTDH